MRSIPKGGPLVFTDVLIFGVGKVYYTLKVTYYDDFSFLKMFYIQMDGCDGIGWDRWGIKSVS